MSLQSIPITSSAEREATPANPDENLLNEKQAARRIGFAANTLAGWRINNSKKRVPLPFILISGSVRYRISDIEKFLQERTVGADGVIPACVKRRKGGPGRSPKPKGHARKQRGAK